MSAHLKKVLKVVLSLGLAALLLYFFLRNLDLAAVGRSITATDPFWLAVAFGVTVVNIPLRSWRWTLLLRTAGKVGQLDAFGSTCVGFAATTLLPARAGEVVRPAVLARRSGLPFTPLLASIGLERLIDLVFVLALFVVWAVSGAVPQGLPPAEASRLLLLKRSAVLVAAGCVAAFGLLAALTVRPSLVNLLLGPLHKLLPPGPAARVDSIARSFLGGLAALRTFRDVVLVFGSSTVVWVVNGYAFHAVLHAFGLAYPLPVSFFVLTWAVLGLAVPTPGGVGGYHAAVAYALTGFYGADPARSAGVALVTHAISFVPITLLGIGFLAASGLSLTRLAEEAPEGTGGDGGEGRSAA